VLRYFKLVDLMMRKWRRRRRFPNGNISVLAILRPEAHEPDQRRTLLEQRNWRYAVKQFDPTRNILSEDWATLENALIRTAGDKYATQKSALFTRRCDSHCVN
jgi:hypothetical protein